MKKSTLSVAMDVYIEIDLDKVLRLTFFEINCEISMVILIYREISMVILPPPPLADSRGQL